MADFTQVPWTCPDCRRAFGRAGQSHMCTGKDVGELFIDRSDDLVLAYDAIIQAIRAWTPFNAGAAKHSIVVTSANAWMIIKPLKNSLDVKMYHHESLDSPRIRRRSAMGKRIAHHIKVEAEYQVDDELIELFRMGFEDSIRT